MNDDNRNPDRKLDRYLAVVVEPPLNVANSLLEEVRKLAGRFRETGGEAVWAGPRNYYAPLTGLAGFDEESLDGIASLLSETARATNEFGMRLSRPEIEDNRESRAMLVSRAFGRQGEIEALTGTFESVLRDAGNETTSLSACRIPLAVLTGEDNIEAMRGCIEDKDRPVAGWLLSGVQLAWISVLKNGLQAVNRAAFIPLKRIGSRR